MLTFRVANLRPASPRGMKTKSEGLQEDLFVFLSYYLLDSFILLFQY